MLLLGLLLHRVALLSFPPRAGGLYVYGARGPPLFMVSGASHGLCSGKAEVFDVP
jgi:hypothetical protein